MNPRLVLRAVSDDSIAVSSAGFGGGIMLPLESPMSDNFDRNFALPNSAVTSMAESLESSALVVVVR